MHYAFQLAAFWGLAFATLALALLLLNIYYSALGADLILRPLGQEAAIAGFASLIEGASAWAVVSFLPAATRAMLIPLLIVAVIYKFTHLIDWNRYHIMLLFSFQLVLGASAACFYFGRFGSALMILGIAGAFLALFFAIVRNL